MAARILLLILLCAIPLCAGGSTLAKDNSKAGSDIAVEWPGAGNIKDFNAACELNRQAGRVIENELSPGQEEKALRKAIEIYKRAIARYPYETAFYDNLAHCYSDLGDDKAAEKCYRKSVEVKEKYRGPENKLRYPDTYLSLARLCVKHKKSKDAEENFKKACRHWRTPECFKEYAQFLKAQKRDEDSKAVLKEGEQVEMEYQKGPGNFVHEKPEK